MCSKLRDGLLSYRPDGDGLYYVCCFMEKSYYGKLIEDYQIPKNGTFDEIYNCEGYWQLREDLLNGKLIAACRNCKIGESDYYNMLSIIDNEIKEVIDEILMDRHQHEKKKNL